MNNNNVLVVFIYYFVKIKHICTTGLSDIVLDIEELFLYHRQNHYFQAGMHVYIFSINTMQINKPRAN